MRSGGNDFNYFKLTKLANFVQFKRMLMFCLEDCAGWTLCSLPWLRQCLRPNLFFRDFSVRCEENQGEKIQDCSGDSGILVPITDDTELRELLNAPIRPGRRSTWRCFQ